jgi:hypothetical protein
VANTETRQPDYIAFTGIVDEDQARRAIKIFETVGFNPDASHRGVMGLAHDLAGRYPDEPIYATVENIRRVIQVVRAEGSRSGVGVGVHFNGETLEVQADEVLRFLDNLNELPAILQLNGRPPHPSVLEAIHRRFPPEELPDFRLAVQIKPETKPELVPSAALALEKMYKGLAHYLNMNSSAGRGQTFSIHERRLAFVALKHAMPNVAIGLPGGLSADNAQSICTEIDTVLNGDDLEHPLTFCVDAEKRLQYVDGPRKGQLDLGLAWGYTSGAAAAILQGALPPD